MRLRKLLKENQARELVLLISVQAFCATFFFFDVISDLLVNHLNIGIHLYLEVFASVILWISVYFEIAQLLRIMRRKIHLEAHYQQSQQTLHEIVEKNFASWKLSPAEHEVAILVFKGYGPSEIAEMRGKSEGTVKAQLSAVYRKAGVPNRAELLMAVIDDIYSEELPKKTAELTNRSSEN